MLEMSIVPEVVYTDPVSVSRGYDELTAKMQVTQTRFPGASFRNDNFDTHHDQAISHWTMFDGAAKPIFVGVSHACFASDSRLETMIGFFEPVT